MSDRNIINMEDDVLVYNCKEEEIKALIDAVSRKVKSTGH